MRYEQTIAFPSLRPPSASASLRETCPSTALTLPFFYVKPYVPVCLCGKKTPPPSALNAINKKAAHRATESPAVQDCDLAQGGTGTNGRFIVGLQPFTKKSSIFMRIIKLGLLSIFFLLLLILLISLLFPSQVRLSRATNLPNDRARIFALLKNDTAWHPAYKDTASATTFANLRKTIVEQSDTTLVVNLQQEGRRPVTSGWRLYGATAADSLTLQWYIDFDLGWKPWQKFSSLFYETTYGTMMENGLRNIKKHLTE